MINFDGRKNPGTLWSSINWNQVRQVVNRLQTRIVKAVKAGNKEKVRSLQRLLARSLAGRLLKDKLLIKPSKSGIISVKQKIKDIIIANKAAKTDNLIAKLNPLIRGWGNYYRHVVSQHAFDKIDSAMWEMTWQWAKRRHPNKSLKWIKSKYFQRKGPKNWVFREKNDKLELLSMSSIPIRRHIKIKANANPYDPHWKEYFDKRSKRSSTGCLTAPYQCLSPVR
jgi:RNA-directed DNA polymerase